MFVSLLLLLVSAGTTASDASPSIVFAEEAKPNNRTVTLGDLADFSRLPPKLSARVLALKVLQAPEGLDRMTFTVTALNQRLRAVAPELGRWLPDDSPTLLTLRLPKEAQTPSVERTRCQQAQRLLTAGDFPVSEDLKPAPCSGQPRAAFRYDAQAGLVRAARDLNPGEVVLAAPLFALAGERAGQPMFLEARVGPVKVVRALQSVRPARAGENFFAKTVDGAVVSVPSPVGGLQ